MKHLESRLSKKVLPAVLLALTLSTACSPSAAIPPVAQEVAQIPVDAAAGARVLDFEALTRDMSAAGKFTFDQLTLAASAAELGGEGNARIFADTQTLDKFSVRNAPIPIHNLTNRSQFVALRMADPDLPWGGQGLAVDLTDWAILKPESANNQVASKIAGDLRLLTARDVVKNPAQLAEILERLGPNGSGVIVRNSSIMTVDTGFTGESLPDIYASRVYNKYVTSMPVVKHEYLKSIDPTNLIPPGNVAESISYNGRLPMLQRIPPGGTLRSLAHSPKVLDTIGSARLTNMLADAVENVATPTFIDTLVDGSNRQFAIMVYPTAKNNSAGIGLIKIGEGASGAYKAYVLDPEFRLVGAGAMAPKYMARVDSEAAAFGEIVASSDPLAARVFAWSKLNNQIPHADVESGIAMKIASNVEAFMKNSVKATVAVGANIIPMAIMLSAKPVAAAWDGFDPRFNTSGHSLTNNHTFDGTNFPERLSIGTQIATGDMLVPENVCFEALLPSHDFVWSLRSISPTEYTNFAYLVPVKTDFGTMAKPCGLDLQLKKTDPIDPNYVALFLKTHEQGITDLYFVNPKTKETIPYYPPNIKKSSFKPNEEIPLRIPRDGKLVVQFVRDNGEVVQLAAGQVPKDTYFVQPGDATNGIAGQDAIFISLLGTRS
jgi:hypothetical protein